MHTDEILTLLGIFGITVSGAGIGYFFARMQNNQDKLESFLKGLESPGIHDEYDDDWDDYEEDTLTVWLMIHHPGLLQLLNKWREIETQEPISSDHAKAINNTLEQRAVAIVCNILNILDSERNEFEEESETETDS